MQATIKQVLIKGKEQFRIYLRENESTRWIRYSGTDDYPNYYAAEEAYRMFLSDYDFVNTAVQVNRRDGSMGVTVELGLPERSLPLVEVRKEREIVDDTWEEAKINWSSIGATSISTAKRFVQVMQQAIIEAEKLEEEQNI